MAFQLETAVFCRETAPPFGAGAAPDAAGAEFPPLVASLDGAWAEFRRMVAPPSLARAEFLRPGVSLRGVGAALRLPGATPICSAGAPARCLDATLSRSGHPAPRGAELIPRPFILIPLFA